MDKPANLGHYVSHAASLGRLPESARPPGPDDSLKGRESRGLAQARYRCLQEAVTAASFRARPTGSLRVTPGSDFVGMRRRVTWIFAQYVETTPRCCDAVAVVALHARICARAGAQVDQHQPFLHVISRTLKSGFRSLIKPKGGTPSQRIET